MYNPDTIMLSRRLLVFCLAVLAAAPIHGQSQPNRSKTPSEADLAQARPGRDPNQPIDEAYTAAIKKYTTETFFLSPLVDYLPASKTVPTPTAVLGDIAGAEGKLPYTREVHDYMRLLAKSTPRATSCQWQRTGRCASARFSSARASERASAS